MKKPLSMAGVFARYFALTMLVQFVLLLGFVFSVLRKSKPVFNSSSPSALDTEKDPGSKQRVLT